MLCLVPELGELHFSTFPAFPERQKNLDPTRHKGLMWGEHQRLHDHVKILVSVKMGFGIHILSTKAEQSTYKEDC